MASVSHTVSHLTHGRCDNQPLMVAHVWEAGRWRQPA